MEKNRHANIGRGGVIYFIVSYHVLYTAEEQVLALQEQQTAFSLCVEDELFCVTWGG